jgi:hypothetical protein
VGLHEHIAHLADDAHDLPLEHRAGSVRVHSDELVEAVLAEDEVRRPLQKREPRILVADPGVSRQPIDRSCVLGKPNELVGQHPSAAVIILAQELVEPGLGHSDAGPVAVVMGPL